MPNQNWISEQKETRGLFSGKGLGNDADRMLEKSDINRWLKGRQPQLIITVRMLSKVLNAPCLGELCDMVESSQMVMDQDSRNKFMKVAIEQWQAKLAALRHKSLEVLT
jgi:hypothetical protein